MDYREMMSFAPKDCQPTVLTADNAVLEPMARQLGKKVEDLTQEEIKEAWERYDNACLTDYDLLTS